MVCIRLVRHHSLVSVKPHSFANSIVKTRLLGSYVRQYAPPSQTGFFALFIKTERFNAY